MSERTNTTMPEIAYLGMGVIGSAMTANLLKAGFVVNVWNRTANTDGVNAAIKAGAHNHATLEAAVQNTGIIFSCLGDVLDVEEVLVGISGAYRFARPNTLFIDLTTIGPQAAKTIAQSLANAGHRFLDAPVTGGDIGAKAGTLTIMCGGTKEDFNLALPALQAIGRNIYLCGPTGSGQALKLCNQVLCAVNMIGVSEAMLLAEQLGIEPKLVVDKLSDGAGASWVLSNLAPRILADDYRSGFAIEHMIKDLRLIEENAGQLELSLLGVKLAKSLFNRAREHGKNNGRQGMQSMILAYRTKEK